MKLLKWERLDPVLALSLIGAKRYQHAYIIGQDERGFTASYRDAACGDAEQTRFIGASLEMPFQSADAAKAACEADLRQILGRRH